MVLLSVIRAKRRFDVRKKVTKLPELEGGGEVYLIWAMPERKRAFPYEVFPKAQMFSKAEGQFWAGWEETGRKHKAGCKLTHQYHCCKIMLHLISRFVVLTEYDHQLM